MNDTVDGVPPSRASRFEAFATAVFDHVPQTALALAIDVVPDQIFRVVASAHEVVVRASGPAVTHVARLVQRVRRLITR